VDSALAEMKRIRTNSPVVRLEALTLDPPPRGAKQLRRS
jgi:hypothetical protein